MKFSGHRIAIWLLVAVATQAVTTEAVATRALASRATWGVVSAAAETEAKSEATWRELAREILDDLISRRTAAGHGEVPAMAESLAERFRRGGFPSEDVHVLPLEVELEGWSAGGGRERTAGLVVRYRGDGSGGRPILLAGHMDVVDASSDDWSIDPFVLTEKDGFLYGRGTTDNKTGITALTTTFLRLKHEGFVPSRDLILAFSGDEETGMLTTRSFVERHRSLVDAELALNSDAGGGALNAAGEPISYQVQAAEKTYATFELTFRNPGGHSSAPRDDNAIYDLAAALARLSAHRFPVQSNQITREFLRHNASLVGGEVGAAMLRFADDPADETAAAVLASRPEWVGITRTTCVATMLRAGHAENALPQKATVTVNCRIFPGESMADVEAELRRVFTPRTGDRAVQAEVEIELLGEPKASPASEPRKDVLDALRVAVDARYPGTPILPYMAAYATDGLELRSGGIPTFGVSGVFHPEDDIRAHGRDERIRVEAFYGALEHWYVLLKTLAG